MADVENNFLPAPKWAMDLVIAASAAKTPGGLTLCAKGWRVLMTLACIGVKGSYPGDKAVGLNLGMSAASVLHHRAMPAEIGGES